MNGAISTYLCTIIFTASLGHTWVWSFFLKKLVLGFFLEYKFAWFGLFMIMLWKAAGFPKWCNTQVYCASWSQPISRNTQRKFLWNKVCACFKGKAFKQKILALARKWTGGWLGFLFLQSIWYINGKYCCCQETTSALDPETPKVQLFLLEPVSWVLLPGTQTPSQVVFQ